MSLSRNNNERDSLSLKKNLEKGKIIYNNQKIINGVKYTDEYQNPNEKSRLLTNGRNNELIIPSSSTTKTINTRYSSKFSRNQNIEVNKSIEKNVSSIEIKAINTRRNLKINSSMMIQREYIKSQLDTADIQQSLNEFEQQLQQINDSYLKSIEGQPATIVANTELEENETTEKKANIDIDSVINHLLSTNKLTLEKLRIINEQIEQAIIRLQQEENVVEDITIKKKEVELNVLQSKCTKYQHKIGNLNSLLEKTLAQELRYTNFKDEISIIENDIEELQRK